MSRPSINPIGPDPAKPIEVPQIVVAQVDIRTITIAYPADPEKLSEALHEAAVAGFAIVDGVPQNEITGPKGGLRLKLTREVKP